MSEPEEFEQLELSSAWAYGGHDAWSLEQRGLPDALVKLLAAADEPELAFATPYHYPRNRNGVGYMVRDYPQTLLEVEVPRVEFPFDPVTPERLALPGPAAWVCGMLPAAMDWQPLSAFPRCAYAGI